jgi:TnpA family transposase
MEIGLTFRRKCQYLLNHNRVHIDTYMADCFGEAGPQKLTNHKDSDSSDNSFLGRIFSIHYLLMKQ